MALANIVPDVSEEFTLASVEAKIVEFSLDNNYPTGGTPGVANALGFRRIFALIPLLHAGVPFEYHPETDKLKCFQAVAPHTHTENTAAAYAQNAKTASADPASSMNAGEVPNGTNLSANTVRALVLGQ